MIFTISCTHYLKGDAPKLELVTTLPRTNHNVSKAYGVLGYESVYLLCSDSSSARAGSELKIYPIGWVGAWVDKLQPFPEL